MRWIPIEIAGICVGFLVGSFAVASVHRPFGGDRRQHLDLESGLNANEKRLERWLARNGPPHDTQVSAHAAPLVRHPALATLTYPVT